MTSALAKASSGIALSCLVACNALILAQSDGGADQPDSGADQPIVPPGNEAGPSDGNDAGPSALPGIHLPGRVQAEDYRAGGEGVAYHDTAAGNQGNVYRTDDVDLKATTDSGGGYAVWYTDAGEWLTYDVAIDAPGAYRVVLRVAQGVSTPSRLHLEIDGTDVTGPIDVANTGGWDPTYADVTKSGVTLPAGAHVLKVVWDATPGPDLNHIDFLPLEPGCGNGVVEDGEQCDSGDCCDGSCHFKAAGAVCRPAAGECDVTEACTGAAATCPANGFKPDDSVCTDGTCHAGACAAAPPPSGVCSASAAPPAQAAAEGLTRLAFCDDFSSNSIAAGTTSDTRDITGSKKWTTELGFGIDGTDEVMTTASLQWHADGTVTIDPDRETYQWYLSSVAKRGGALHGYFIDRKTRWYAEVRWRFDHKGGGQPAFWSMDTCHVYGWPGPCTQHGNRFIEPDFWEYFSAVTSTHYYQEGTGGPIRLTRCNRTNNGAGVAIGEWFSTGHMYTGGGTSDARQRYYKNDNLIYTRTTSTGGCVDGGGGSTADFIAEMSDGRYPIYLGSKIGDVITYDFVRVWEHPADQ